MQRFPVEFCACGYPVVLGNPVVLSVTLNIEQMLEEEEGRGPLFKLKNNYLISASTQDVRPYSAAECIAVHPSAVLELTSAPCLRRASKHARCPYSAA